MYIQENQMLCEHFLTSSDVVFCHKSPEKLWREEKCLQRNIILNF